MSSYLVLGILLFISTSCVIPVKALDEDIKQRFQNHIDDVKKKTELVKETNVALKEEVQNVTKELESAAFQYTSTKNILSEEDQNLLEELYKLNMSIDIMEQEISLFAAQVKVLKSEDEEYKFLIRILTGEKKLLKKRRDDGDEDECFTIEGADLSLTGTTNLILDTRNHERGIKSLKTELTKAQLKLNEAETDLRNTEQFLNELKAILKSRKENYNKFIDDFLATEVDPKETINVLKDIQTATSEKRNKLENEKDSLTESTSKDKQEAHELKEDIVVHYTDAKSCYSQIISHI